MFTFRVQPPLVRTKMNEVVAYNIHIIEFDILFRTKMKPYYIVYYIHTEFDKRPK